MTPLSKWKFVDRTDMPDAEMGRFPEPGCQVELHSLASAARFNGMRARVLGKVEDTGRGRRLKVQLHDGGKILSIKPTNTAVRWARALWGSTADRLAVDKPFLAGRLLCGTENLCMLNDATDRARAAQFVHDGGLDALISIACGHWPYVYTGIGTLRGSRCWADALAQSPGGAVYSVRRVAIGCLAEMCNYPEYSGPMRSSEVFCAAFPRMARDLLRHYRWGQPYPSMYYPGDDDKTQNMAERCTNIATCLMGNAGAPFESAAVAASVIDHFVLPVLESYPLEYSSTTPHSTADLRRAKALLERHSNDDFQLCSPRMHRMHGVWGYDHAIANLTRLAQMIMQNDMLRQRGLQPPPRTPHELFLPRVLARGRLAQRLRALPDVPHMPDAGSLSTADMATDTLQLERRLFGFACEAASPCHVVGKKAGNTKKKKQKQQHVGVCELCGVRAPLNFCSGCHAAAWCSRACQKNAFKRHKTRCRAFRTRKGFFKLLMQRQTQPFLTGPYRGMLPRDVPTSTPDMPCISKRQMSLQLIVMRYASASADFGGESAADKRRGLTPDLRAGFVRFVRTGLKAAKLAHGPSVDLCADPKCPGCLLVFRLASEGRLCANVACGTRFVDPLSAAGRPTKILARNLRPAFDHTRRAFPDPDPSTAPLRVHARELEFCSDACKAAVVRKLEAGEHLMDAIETGHVAGMAPLPVYFRHHEADWCDEAEAEAECRIMRTKDEMTRRSGGAAATSTQQQQGAGGGGAAPGSGGVGVATTRTERRRGVDIEYGNHGEVVVREIGL